MAIIILTGAPGVGRTTVVMDIAHKLKEKEFRNKEYSELDKELFVRKPIGNEELIKEINHLFGN